MQYALVEKIGFEPRSVGMPSPALCQVRYEPGRGLGLASGPAIRVTERRLRVDPRPWPPPYHGASMAPTVTARFGRRIVRPEPGTGPEREAVPGRVARRTQSRRIPLSCAHD